jgi:hypothetical protein
MNDVSAASGVLVWVHSHSRFRYVGLWETLGGKEKMA